MRTSVIVGAAALAILGVGGSLAWAAVSRADVTPLTVHVTDVAPPPIAGTQDASVVWTGDEFIVWGGGSGDQADGRVRADGAAYDPTSDRWRPLASAPIEARERHAAVWTGSEMVVWGGTRRHHGVGDLLDGAAYDPATDSWRTVSPAPAGTDRSGGQAVAVRGRIVIGAGFGPTGGEERTVLVHDLADDRWDTVPVADPVVHLLPVGDEVALLTARHAQDEDDAAELRVALLDPSTGEVRTVGHLAPETYPYGAGLLAHDGELTVVVAASYGGASLYPVDVEGLGQPMAAERTFDIGAPVWLFGGPEPQPVLHDGARRMLIAPPSGPVAGIDLATGDLARGGQLDGAALCLPNASHAVAGRQLLVWGTGNCRAGAEDRDGAALVEFGWGADPS